jgi:hypothetical protein
MRSRVFLPLFFLPLSVACTAILGDFSVGNGNGDGGDGGGGDVSNPDGSDGGGLALLACGEVNGERHAITTNASLHGAGLHIAQLPNSQMMRVVLADFPATDGGNGPQGTLHAYTIDPHNTSNMQDAQLPTNSGEVVSMIRYPGQNGPAGFAALWVQYDMNLQTNFLYAARIPDDGSAWTTPKQLSKVGNNQNNTDATFIVLNPTNDDYFIAFSSLANNQQTIIAGHSAGSADQLNQIAQFNATSKGAAYNFVTPGIAMDGQTPYILLNQNTQGPPQPGLTELLLGPQGQQITITPPSTLNYLPAGFTNSPDQTKANAIFLSADLSAEQGSYLVGRVPFTSLSTWDPGTLPSSTPPAPSQPDAGYSALSRLLFNSQPHWEMAGGAEQLLFTSPTVDPLLQKLYGGINFGWWDSATGAMRAYVAGSDHLFGDVPFIVGSDTTFISLAGSLAQIEVAYLSAPNAPSGGDFPPPAADLWLAQIGCQKP